MTRSVRSLVLATAVFAAAAVVPVSAAIKMSPKQGIRDIILQEVKADLGPGVKVDEMYRRDFDISISTNKSSEGDVFTFDDKIELQFTSKKDCYLTVLDFTPSGQLVVLFPNQWATDNFVKADQQIRIPPAEAKFELKSGGPVGTDRVTVIATTKPEKVVDIDTKKITNAFAVIDDREAQAVTRQIVVVAKEDEELPPTPPTPDPNNGSVTGGEPKPPVDGTPAEPPVGEPPAEPPKPEIKPNVTGTENTDKNEWAVAHIAVHNRSKEDAGSFVTATKGDWVVKLWTEKPDYKAGDKMIVRLQTNQPGKLTELSNLGASGNINPMLPAGEAIDLKEGIINVLPGKDHKFIYEASAPAGADSIIAKITNEKGESMDLTVKLQTAN